ncbi:hypothetical protein ACIPLC_25060 [Kitasatospora sp. NPDC086801]|uniref:hypothetical protein n=1 Tax=Kitasatospora sp. NPDC086801 TaxID=3364066 RepID=UPI003821FB59
MTTKAGTTVPTPEPAPVPARRPAPWVRTRLRATPLAALLTATLAFVTVFMAAAFPRVVDRGADSALQDFVRQLGVNATSLQVTAQPSLSETASDLDAVQRKLTAEVGRDLPLTQTGQLYGSRAKASRDMLNKGYARLSDHPPVLSLMYLNGLGDAVTLTDGVWPGPAAEGAPLPIVINQKAGETIGVKLGDVIDNGSDMTGQTRSTVVGFYRVNNPDDPRWEDVGCPARACMDGQGSELRWKTTGFVGDGSLPQLIVWGKGGQDFWRLPVDPGALRADQLAGTRDVVGSYLVGRGATALADATHRPDLHVSSLLPDVFTRATVRYNAAAPLAAIGPAGAAGVAVVVLCLAAALTADRRTAELRLLQARGGSRGGILLRLLGEGAATVLPAALLGTALALVLLPAPRWGNAVLVALAATLIAVLAFPARAAALLSPPKAVAGWRRLVGELAVLAVTAAAVAEVRRRGVAPGNGLDPLLVAAPLMLALTGGLLLARIQPVVVGWLAALAGRGRGLIGFLGLARSARDTSGRRRPSALPLLALVIAVTTTGFGATVLDTVDSVRMRAARIATGGDASVSVPVYATLPETFTTAAAELPGVRAATGVWVEPGAHLIGADQDSTSAILVVAEPKAYAEIARTFGVGEFDPALLAGTPGGPDTPVPALFSTGLSKELAGGPPRLRTPNGGELRTTVAGIVAGTPALPDPGKPFMVVPVGPASERLPELKRTNKWLSVGDVDAGQVRGLLLERGLTGATGLAKLIGDEAAAAGKGSHGLPPGYTVRSSQEAAALLAADPLQHSAERLFWYAGAAGAGFALLAVLLTLVRAAPERTALLARLRTMGLRPRQGLALIVTETLPQALVAAVGGGLVALAAVGLLGPAFDLSALVGANVGDVLAPVLLPVLLPTAGLALLVCLGVVLETLVAGRRQIATELRAGDQR